jgi:hypothetical protein
MLAARKIFSSSILDPTRVFFFDLDFIDDSFRVFSRRAAEQLRRALQ